MALCITPPRQFQHAGDLPPQSDGQDPRCELFTEDTVEIDLRECEFIRPQAALWCVVYLALASRRRARSRLLLPANMGCRAYLKSLGIIDVLGQRGVDVDDPGIGDRQDAKIVLPATPFVTTTDANRITNIAFERLQENSPGTANLTPVVTELFSELALNAAQHSESPIGAFGCVQFFQFRQSSRFACVIADGGIGVRSGLCKNDSLRRRITHDWDALELAIRERVSGTGDPHRGIGLYGVSEDIRQPGRSLLLHSGIGSLEINENLESAARRTRLFPGTLAFLAIPA